MGEEAVRRDDFERWAAHSVGQPSFAGYHSEGGVWVYRHNIMQLMWQCWQAASREKENSNRQS